MGNWFIFRGPSETAVDQKVRRRPIVQENGIVVFAYKFFVYDLLLSGLVKEGVTDGILSRTTKRVQEVS